MSKKQDIVIPEGWRIENIGNVVNRFEDGGTPSRNNKSYFGGDINWVVIDDIKHFISSTKETLTKEGYNKSSTKLFNKGSIILSFGATIGEVGIAKKSLTTKQGIAGIEVNTLLLNNIYFYYYLVTQKGKLNALAVGSTIKEIRPGTIKEKFLIPFPQSLKEQEKIADILSILDEVIENTDRLIEKYKKIKTGLMEDLFTSGIDIHTGKPHTKFKDSELGRIPEGWDFKPIFTVTDYVDYRGKTPTKVEEGRFLVTARNIKGGVINYSLSQEFIKESDYNIVMSRGLPKIGDVLFTTEAPMGEVANVNNESIALAQRIIKFRGKEKYLNNYFLKYSFTSNYFVKLLKSESAGSTVEGIKGSRLHNLKIKLPKDIKEQEKIAEILTEADNKIEQEEAYKEKLEKIKKGLMNDLLTGKVRVKF